MSNQTRPGAILLASYLGAAFGVMFGLGLGYWAAQSGAPMWFYWLFIAWVVLGLPLVLALYERY